MPGGRSALRPAGLALVLLLATGSPAGAAGAQPAAAPLARPATVLRTPQRAALLGLAQAGARVVAVGERGAVLLSDDGGRQWRQAQAVPVSVTLTAVHFANARTGWAVGHQGVALRSDDGGEHWRRQLDGQAIAQLLLKDAQTRGDARAVAEAERAVAEGADKPLLAVDFSSADEGVVLGAFNLLLSTTDGGQSWQTRSADLPNPKGAHLYALHRQGNTWLLAGEQGLLLHSADGGRHFERVATPYQGSWFAVSIEPSGAWLLAGLRGNVMRSADAGRSWQALANPVPASVTALGRDAQGAPWLMNQAGQLLQAGASAVQPGGGTPAQQPAALLQLADGRWLVAGWNGITTVPAHPPTPPNPPAAAPAKP